MNWFSSFLTLKQVATALQFHTTISKQSSTKHLSWCIELREGKDEGVLWEFAHELGHAIQFRRKKKATNSVSNLIEVHKNRSKFKVLIDEVEAWIIGYVICKLFNISTKGILRYSMKCLKTYF
jgi:hypothetical protein